MKLSQEWEWFLKYLVIFFAIPMIGTLAHELGHWLVALIYNQPAQIAYAFTFCVDANGHQIGCLDVFSNEQYFWFIMGGPISTWLVAVLGILVILWKYRSMHAETEKTIGVGQTLALIATSFGLRFIFNAGGYFGLRISGNSSTADEVKIANYLGIHPDILMYGSAIIALILVLTALYYIPRHQRLIILVAGITGGILGYLFWYYWVGPIVLPYPP